jgi:hypothetical protein
MTEEIKAKFHGREHRLGIVSWTPFSNVERAVLIVASIVCGGVCIWVGNLLGIPREPHFSGSLLLGGAAASAIITAAVSIAICMMLGVVIAAFFNREAGLFCCCVGLSIFAVRCGPIRPVLQYASGPGALITLAIETALLGGLLVGGWQGLLFVFHRLHPEPAPDLNHHAPNEQHDATFGEKFSTLAVAVVGMALCEQILIQTDVLAQTMAGTLISAFIGVMAAYMFRPLTDGIWYWTAPAVLGVIGYLLAYFYSGGIQIGDLHGWTGPLARPTPLIYISMGTAGALLGYWCSRRWAQPETQNAE